MNQREQRFIIQAIIFAMDDVTNHVRINGYDHVVTEEILLDRLEETFKVMEKTGISSSTGSSANKEIEKILNSDQGPYEKLYNIKQLIGE